MPELNLKINDIVDIRSPDASIQHRYRINFLDEARIELVSEHPITFILEDGVIQNYVVDEIILVDRKGTGYAKEHDLIPGTWVNIRVRGEVPKIIVGKITDLDEDMIELQTYPEHQSLYIDFGYRGMPDDIESIEIRKKPNEPNEPQAMDTDEPIPMKTMEEVLQGMEIEYGEILDNVQQTVEVDEKYRRYSIEEQCQDLYDELLNQVALEHRMLVQRDIQRVVQSFQELRKEFSVLDHLGHVIDRLSYAADYRPCIPRLTALTEVPLWSIPVVYTEPKLYDILGIDVQDYTDIHMDTMSSSLHYSTVVSDQYYNNVTVGDENKYDAYYRKLTSFFTPYEGEHCIYPKQRLDAILCHDGMLSPFTNGVSIQWKQGIQGFVEEQSRAQYKVRTKVMAADSVCVRSFVFRDERGMQLSRVTLPSTPIYQKAELARIFSPYSIQKDPYHTITMDDPFDPFSFQAERFAYPSHYVYESDSMPSDYLNKIIPTNREWISMNHIHYYTFQQWVESLNLYCILPKHIQAIDARDMHKKIEQYQAYYTKHKTEHQQQFQLLLDAYNKNRVDAADTTLTPLFQEETKDIEFLYHYADQQTSSERLQQATRIDQTRLLTAGISLHFTSLEMTQNIDNVIRTELAQYEPSKMCPIDILAKQYTTSIQLKYDNDKEILFDSVYDKTHYTFIDKYIAQRKSMTTDDFIAFLAKEILKEYKMTYADAVKEARSMIKGPGKRLVENGQYAVLTNDPPVYYKRVRNKWVESKVSSPETFFCNMTDCIDKDGHCITPESNKFTLKKTLLKNVLDEYQVHKYVSMDIHTTYLKERYASSIQLCKRLKKVRANLIKKYNDDTVAIAKDLVPVDIQVDPVELLLRRILGNQDMEYRSTQLIEFAQAFTRHANGEDDHYLYSIDSNVKLLPVFIFELAGAYLEGYDVYEQLLEECKQKYGTLTDTGSEWVDKKSGETFDTVMLDTKEGYDAAGAKLMRETLEEDISIQAILQEQTFTLRQKDIASILSGMMTALQMVLPTQDSLFIISQAGQQVDAHLPSRENYEKKPQPRSYDMQYDLVLIFQTCTVLFAVLQTSIPAKSKTTYPGCIKSLTGYPMTEDNQSGMDYIACILSKLVSSKPWSSLKGISQPNLLKYMRKFMDDFTLQNTSIIALYDKKRSFLDDRVDIPKEHSIDFLPPLVPVTGLSISPPAPSMIHSLTHAIRTGDKSQFAKIGTLQGKVIHLSMYILERIEAIISKEEPFFLMDKYPSNTCCNESREGIRSFLQKKDPIIYTTSTMVETYSKSLDWIQSVTRGNIMSFQQSTRYVVEDYLPTYAEAVMYQSYIYLCKFNQSVILDDALLTLCPYNTSTFLRTDTLREKINIMKKEGKQYDQESFEKLIDVHFKNNRVTITTTTVAQPLDLFRKAIADSIYVPKTILSATTTFLDASTDVHSRSLKNILAIQTKQYKDNILAFFEKTSVLTRQVKKEYTEFSELLTQWYSDTPEHSMMQYTHFLTGVLHRFSVTYPTMILNHVNYVDTATSLIPEHLKISDKHRQQLKDKFSLYYGELHSFYDTEVKELLQSVQETTKDILHLSTITPFETFDIETIRLWFEFYVFFTLNAYVDLSNMGYTSPGIEDKEDSYTSRISNSTEIVAKIMLMYIRNYLMDKRVVNISFDKITSFMQDTRLSERKSVVESIGKLSAQERSSDKLLRKYKLGRWAAGKMKGLVTYDKATYDKDFDNTVENVDVLNEDFIIPSDNYDLLEDIEKVTYEGMGNDDIGDDPYDF